MDKVPVSPCSTFLLFTDGDFTNLNHNLSISCTTTATTDTDGDGIPDCLDNLTGIGGVLCLLAKNSEKEAERLRDSWQEALDFWDTANDKYKLAIGALETPVLSITENCVCSIGLGVAGAPTFEFTIPGACAATVPANCKTRVQTELGELLNHPSDGVVLMKSAIDYPNAKIGEEMTGSNHQQMRNDQNTKERLNELWTGGHGIFFKTPEKQ